MFLKKTNLEKYNNNDILLLGEWAQTEKDNDFKILDYHWKNIDKVEQDNDYLFSLYEKIIPFLSKELNSIHNTKYSNRFWEIFVGPWFLKFIEVLFDRYYMLKIASENYKNLNTDIIDNSTIPSTFAEFHTLTQNDYFNLELYSKLLVNHRFNINTKEIKLHNKLKNLNTNNKYKNNNINLKKNINFKFILKKVTLKSINLLKLIYYPILNLINFINRIYGEKNNVIINLNLPITKSENRLLFKKVNQTFFLNKPLPALSIDRNKIDYSLRNKLINIDFNHKDDFLSLILKLTFIYIPLEYLEEYNRLSTFYKNYLSKKKIKLALVRAPIEYKFVMRLFTAFLSENGTKILSCQEGGGLGTKKYNQFDEKMYLIGCDNFLTWGWKPKNQNAIKFFVTKTFWIKKYTYKHDGDILLVGGSCRRYHYSLYEGHLPSFNHKHIDTNINLIKNINNKAFDKLIYRFHVEMGYCEIEKVLSKIKKLRISTRSDNQYYYYDLLYNSRLAICTSDYTSNLQPLMINHPTIWLWDPKYFAPRDSVKIFYDQLHKAGILFYCPIECSKKINEIFQDPMKWWMTDKVQEAKNNFVNNICKVEKNMVNELANIINKKFLN